jgi:sporulation protein YlmC with PRC-barrel domain
MYTINMLQLSGMIINRPVMSLRTGTQVATALAPIINPNNLKIEGFWCKGDRRQQLILVSQDIRDSLPQGLVVNDADVLTDQRELVRLTPVIQINFELLGKAVETSGGRKLGKVNDYATDTDSMFIKKLYVSQPLYKNFSGGNLGIDRTQIVEITDKKIVVNDLEAKVPAGAHAVA